MTRSLKKPPFFHPSLLSKIKKNKDDKKKLTKVIKTRFRSSTILPIFVGLSFGVYNGKIYITVRVNEEMVGHKLGEFSPTRSYYGHGDNKKVGKK